MIKYFYFVFIIFITLTFVSLAFKASCWPYWYLRVVWRHSWKFGVKPDIVFIIYNDSKIFVILRAMHESINVYSV